MIQEEIFTYQYCLENYFQIEHYVAEYTDVTGWEKEWALLEESASQAASALLSTLARDDRFDAKLSSEIILKSERINN